MWMKNKDLVQFKRFSSDRKYLYRDIDQTEYACLKLWHVECHTHFKSKILDS